MPRPRCSGTTVVPNRLAVGPRAPSLAAPTLEDLERARIVEALRRSRGRRGEAAEILGISRCTLWRKLKTLGLQ